VDPAGTASTCEAAGQPYFGFGTLGFHHAIGRARHLPRATSLSKCQRGRDLYTWAISVAEILYGIDRLSDGRKNKLLESAAVEVFGIFAEQILPFDSLPPSSTPSSPVAGTYPARRSAAAQRRARPAHSRRAYACAGHRHGQTARGGFEPRSNAICSASQISRTTSGGEIPSLNTI
jgi:hypothetical protein